MIFLLLLFLCSSHLCAIIIEGISFDSHSDVKMLADKHPTVQDKPDQNKIKDQLAVINAFLERQPKQNTVVLAEEISPSIAQCIKPHEACILNDMRTLAECHGLNYENIDLRGATLAAGHVLKRCLRGASISSSLSFGPTKDALKRPSLVTLDDLFEEKERYIVRIKERFSWSDQEQKRSDLLHKVLLKTLQGQDLGTMVYDFCQDSSPVAKNQQKQVCNEIGDMSMYLFDNYTKKMVMEYNSKGHTVLLAAGFMHIQNIQDQLIAERGWDYRIYSNGDALTDYNLKSMLGIVNCWDHAKNRFRFLC